MTPGNSVWPLVLSALALLGPTVAMAQNLEFPLVLPAKSADRTGVPFVHDRASRVLILGYHRFAKKKADSLSITDKELRQQLADVRQAGFTFIPMEDFLAWRREEKNIPALSAVVTVDDGFLSTLTIADPIFRELHVPYTVAAYPAYVGNGSQALTWEQLRKMKARGVDIGSHSATHQAMSGPKTPKAKAMSEEPERDRHKYAKAYGSELKAPREVLARLSQSLSGGFSGATEMAGGARWSQVGLARNAYEEWVWAETFGSRERFAQELGLRPLSFTYPFGIYSDRVAEMVMDAGYEAAFTVNGEEVNFATPIDRIHRFIIMSDKPELFQKALQFRVAGATLAGDPAELPAGVTVSPARHEPSSSRTPVISANVKAWLEAGADPAKFSLRLSGFGPVPFTLDAATGMLTARVPARLRGPSHTAFITGADAAGERLTLRWSFLLPEAIAIAVAVAE